MLHPIRCLLYNSILSVNPGIEFKLLLIISGITGIGISIPVALLTGIPGIPGNTVSALFHHINVVKKISICIAVNIFHI